MVKLSYSFIFITRRNFPLINTDSKEEIIRKIFLDVAESHNLKLVAFRGLTNHVGLTVETSEPGLNPLQISHYLRCGTSKRIRDDINLEASHLPSLWIRENWIGNTFPSEEEISIYLSSL